MEEGPAPGSLGGFATKDREVPDLPGVGGQELGAAPPPTTVLMGHFRKSRYPVHPPTPSPTSSHLQQRGRGWPPGGRWPDRVGTLRQRRLWGGYGHTFRRPASAPEPWALGHPVRPPSHQNPKGHSPSYGPQPSTGRAVRVQPVCHHQRETQRGQESGISFFLFLSSVCFMLEYS